jgi:polysaccharide biosynthesis transport protein
MSSALSPYSLRAVPAQVSRDDGEFQPFPEPAPEGGTFDLLRYWKAVRKRLWIVITAPLVAAAFVGFREMRLPDLYTASSTILIRSSAPKVFGESAAPLQSSGSEADTGDTDMVLATKYELLQTPDLALQVIRADDLVHNDAFTGVALMPTMLGQIKARIVGARPHPHPMQAGSPEDYIGAYLGSLAIEPVTGTQLVRVSFTTRDSKLSAELANAHVRQFIAQGIQLNPQASEDAERFLRNKLADLSARWKIRKRRSTTIAATRASSRG